MTSVAQNIEFAILKILMSRYDLAPMVQVHTLKQDTDPVSIDKKANSELTNSLWQAVQRQPQSRVLVTGMGILMPFFLGPQYHVLQVQGAGLLQTDRLDQIRNYLDQLVLLMSQPFSAQPVDNIFDQQAEAQTTAFVSQEMAEKALNKKQVLGTNSPLFIEAPAHAPVRELALEFHSHSSRAMFLNIGDLDPEQIQSWQDLDSLGPITLYIPEVENLDQRLQKIVSELIQNKKESLETKIIASSSKDLAELVLTGELRPDFHLIIQGGYLKWPTTLNNFAVGGVRKVLEILLSTSDAKGRPRLQLIH